MRRFSLLVMAVAALLLVTACGTRKKTQTRPVRIEVTEIEKAPKPEKIDGRTVVRILKEAERWKGTPYAYGGKTRRGTDCSGMVMTIYQDVAGIKLPRSAAEQQQYCRKIDKKKLQPADLVFFTTSRKRGRVNHVGIYTGDGAFIHASSSRGVIKSRLDEDYYVRHYHSSGRVDNLPGRGNNVEELPAVKEIELPPDKPLPSSPVSGDVPTITLEEFIKMQTPLPKDTTSVFMPVDSIGLKADSIRTEVRNAF